MAREMIEFECNDCQGFFRINLNLGVDGDFVVECPKCKRQHPRSIKKGEVVAATVEARIYRDGEGKRIKRNGKENMKLDVISVPMSAYSKESCLAKIKTASDGDFAKQSWFDRVAKKITG
jgi:predicted Zn finger-like uncharacterized protein